MIRHLLEETEHDVVSLDALTYAGNLENLADVLAHPRLSFVHGDIRDRRLVRELVEGVDVIVNAAAESHVVTYGLPIVIVRPFNNYGPRQHPEKVVPRFITQALSDEPLTIHGDGHASRDWLYVLDDAEAIAAAVEAPLERVAGETINVATGVDISVAAVADLVLALLGKPQELREHVVERPGQVDRHIGSTAKAERVLGWRARTAFEDGLERTVAWYRDNEAWWRGILARETRAYSS